MGNTFNDNEKYPPPFHLNVNRPPGNRNYLYNDNKTYKKEPFDNTSRIPNALKLNEKNISDHQEKNDTKLKRKNKYKESFELEDEEEEEDKKKRNIKKKSKNRYEDNDDMPIDIDILNKNRVNVKIPLSKKKVWQKEYNNNELIGKVINDYITENDLKLPNNFFNEIKCFNKKVSLQDKIISLFGKDNEDMEKKIYYDEEKSIDLSHLNEQFTDIMGKPFFNPFEILCFYKSQRKFKTLHYNNDLTEKTGINKFDATSSYCNGWSHIYISGGENCINKLWDINLKKNIIHDPVIIPPKKFHSMIFIPKSIVFIVGGNNLDTFYFNLKEKKVYNWGKLNLIRIEPALQIIKNKLYCMDCSNSINFKNNYTIETTELTSNTGKWKLLKPKLTYNTINASYTQKLFGICKDKDDNIIFIGGKFTHNEEAKNDNNNFMYNIANNTIGISQVKYYKFDLKEKAFCPFNKSYDYILTDFARESPQIAFYNKKKGKIELINFSPEENSQKDETKLIAGQNLKKNLIDKTSIISPIFSFGEKDNQNNNNNKNINNNQNNIINQNNNNKDTKNGIYVSFNPQVNSLNVNGNFVGLRNPNTKLINNITPINNFQNTNNHNYIKNSNLNNEELLLRKNTPQFGNDQILSNNNQIDKSPLFNNQESIIDNRQTVGTISRTPDKYINKLPYTYIPNIKKTTVKQEHRNNAHSFDTGQRYYYPRFGLNNYYPNKNIYHNIFNQYYKNKYQ